MNHDNNNGAISQPNSIKEKFSVVKNSDWEWALSQHHTVSRLWMECWKSDPFGDRFASLHTKNNINSSSFRQAKKIIQDACLFEFKPVQEKSKTGQLKTVSWLIRNVKGSKAIKQAVSDNLVSYSDNLVSYSDNLVSYSDNLHPQTLATQAFHEPSLIDPVRIQEKEINTGSSNTEQDLFLYTEIKKNKLDQVIGDPYVSAQARESVYGDEAALDAAPLEVLERAKANSQDLDFVLFVGMQPTLDATVAHEMVEAEHKHSISDSQEDQQDTCNPVDNGLIKSGKTTGLNPKFEAYYSERAKELMSNPIDPALLKEPFSPFVDAELVKVFGKHLRGLAETTVNRKLNKSEIRAALNQDWVLVKNQENSDRLLELLRLYIRYNFQEITENIYVSTLYKHVA